MNKNLKIQGKSKKYFFIFIFIFILSLSIVSSISYNLGPKVEVFNTQTKSLNLDDIDKNEELAFKMTLVNEQSYWLCSKDWSVQLDISNDKKEDIGNLAWNYNSEFCLAPKKKLEIWLLFSQYNNMNEDDRMKKWKVIPTISLSNPSSRELIDTSNTKSASVEKQGKYLEFTVSKDDPSTGIDTNKIKKVFDEGWEYWVIRIGGGLITLIVLFTLIFKSNKK